MKATELNEFLRGKETSYTKDGYPYTCDGLCCDGGFFTLYVPSDLDIKEVVKQKRAIRMDRDVVTLDVVRYKQG
jgi:hypothetical protein